MECSQVRFEINTKVVAFTEIPATAFLLRTDDAFTTSYIQQAISAGYLVRFGINSDEDITNLEIMRLTDPGKENPNSAHPGVVRPDVIPIELQDATESQNIDSSAEPLATTSQTADDKWKDTETRYVLNKYAKYLDSVGPMKRFKRKKDMWRQISADLLKDLTLEKSPVQVENRYKTVLKRKKVAVDNNSKSGSSRIDIPFENEMADIASLDDSIEPEVLRSATVTRIIQKPEKVERRVSIPRPKPIQEVLFEMHEAKEKAKERRHLEKLQLIRELLSNNNT